MLSILGRKTSQAQVPERLLWLHHHDHRVLLLLVLLPMRFGYALQMSSQGPGEHAVKDQLSNAAHGGKEPAAISF